MLFAIIILIIIMSLQQTSYFCDNDAKMVLEGLKITNEFSVAKRTLDFIGA